MRCHGLSGEAAIRPLGGALTELSIEKSLCQDEFAMNGGGRNLQRRGSFVVGQSPEKQKLNQFAFALILNCQPLQCLVQVDNSFVGLRSDHNGFIEGNFLKVSAPFLAIVRLGVVDEYAAQEPR